MTQDRTITMLLAGGVGSRLAPLTEHRAKPGVPFGGKYRIIDFTLSNCYHSGLRKILVLTQYKSQSLQKHLRDGWSIFNPGIGEYITPVPPQMRTGESWYVGTADAQPGTSPKARVFCRSAFYAEGFLGTGSY